MEEFLIQEQPRILGVFAHPDDETFCAGGTFAKYSASGAEVMVVSATRGGAGQIRTPEVATRYTLESVREQELHQACKRLGVQQSLCLKYRDGTLKDVKQEELITQILKIFYQFRPDIVITFGPDGGYGHPDHIAISAATTAACQRYENARIFDQHTASSSHHPLRLYYSHFPAKQGLLLELLVQWLVQSEKRFHRTPDFAYALLLLTEEARLLRYSSDHFAVNWYPTRSLIIEQGEAANSLYLILSGEVDVIREHADGTLETLARLGPGAFFGEEELAWKKPHNAHVMAVENVTCLVFSPSAPMAFLGRGEGAHMGSLIGVDEQGEGEALGVTTCVDVSPYIHQKVAAIAAHRSQYAIEVDMFPLSIMQELMGMEYFVRVYPTPKIKRELFPLLFTTSV